MVKIGLLQAMLTLAFGSGLGVVFGVGSLLLGMIILSANLFLNKFIGDNNY